ncbi:RUN and FYVE domain-containing protein 4 [Sciurus carolinensis]|uniref:RUN and FYVE domain-containing protein 4 n=1 Tax=Sciurus carolinensis TaxID=30640 RepID=A0AA41T1X7_SCICA|nr:RUN and FYVE domain-containing protein 4 [Sciurus carolinensis]
MADDGAVLRVTRDLKAAVSAILQGYGEGQGPVTDASAELHRLCGCLEQLLQFDQKEQKSFLGPRKDYWDFLCTALRRQRGDTEQIRFIYKQEKLKTPLGRGRAFLRFCLARGQLAESLQLCLLSPGLLREWYGPRSPLLCPELREDILDSLYALNGVAFDLDLQRPDLDGAWPMFSEGVQLEEPLTSQASCLQDPARGGQPTRLPRPQPHKHLPSCLETQIKDSRSLGSPQNIWEPEQEIQPDLEEGAPRPREKFPEDSRASIQPKKEGAREVQKEVTGMAAEGTGILPGAEAQRTEGVHGGETEQGPIRGLLVSSSTVMTEEATAGSRPGWFWVPQDPGTKEGPTTEKPQEPKEVTSLASGENGAEEPLQEVVKNLRHGLQKAEEQTQRQELQLKTQEGELRALREQLSRCQEEKAWLQAEMEQKQQEAERRDAMYGQQLAEQRDLIQAMKTRVLELTQDKDRQWQRLQQLSSVAPAVCVGCSKVFSRLSRRYPCRLCGGLVCHACSADYKKEERCCPPCAQGGEAQVT